MDTEATGDAILPAVEDILLYIRRRKRLSSEEWEDFHSWVWLKLVESNYAAIRKFDRRGQLRAYLAVVLSRYLLDYRVHKWGKWRPSATAQALGAAAVELERLIERDRCTVSEAVQALLANGNGAPSEETLYELAAKLPMRTRDWTVSEEWLDELRCGRPSPEAELGRRELDAARAGIESALTQVLEQLSAEDRVALKLRFEQRMKLNEVARALGYNPKRFYRRFQRILNRVRRRLERKGVDLGKLRMAFPDSEWREFADSSRP